MNYIEVSLRNWLDKWSRKFFKFLFSLGWMHIWHGNKMWMKNSSFYVNWNYFNLKLALFSVFINIGYKKLIRHVLLGTLSTTDQLFKIQQRQSFDKASKNFTNCLNEHVKVLTNCLNQKLSFHAAPKIIKIRWKKKFNIKSFIAWNLKLFMSSNVYK